jgi:hypothetical protein
MIAVRTTRLIALAALVAACAPDTTASGQVVRERREHLRAQRGDAPGPTRNAQAYSIEQAMSDRAQLHTIAFSGLAFLTGDFGAATFLPPGKVCDFFGFQYMRDIDAAQKGHNPIFLNRIAGNVLRILDAGQRSTFERAARADAGRLRALAEMRYPLIMAFHQARDGGGPAGSRGLDRAAVARYAGDLFALDAEVSYGRARVFGQVAASLTADQRARLGAMKFGDFGTWPDVEMEDCKLPRGTEKLVNVAYMTYASEFFSWYAGSVEADAYFCPERHGTYFGGFYLKDMPAMGRRDYDISTSLTGDSGAAFLGILTAQQRALLTEIPDRQRKTLLAVAGVRRAISVELRAFLRGGQADREKVVALGRRYGELDGELSWRYATAFAAIHRTLSAEQREALAALRDLDGYASAPAYVFSDPIPGAAPQPDTDRFFGSTAAGI